MPGFLATCPAAAPILRLAACVTLMGLVGCGGGPRRAAPVDPEAARTVLRTTLDHWKQGQSLDSLAAASPAITAQDFDWQAGYTLNEYQVLDDGRNDDANLRVKVELDLRDPDGREVRKQVSYVVGTSPSATVFREMND